MVIFLLELLNFACCPSCFYSCLFLETMSCFVTWIGMKLINIQSWLPQILNPLPTLSPSTPSPPPPPLPPVLGLQLWALIPLSLSLILTTHTFLPLIFTELSLLTLGPSFCAKSIYQNIFLSNKIACLISPLPHTYHMISTLLTH